MDMEEAIYLLARNVAEGRWFVVFICFLLISAAEGAFRGGIYSQTQSDVDQGTDINEYVPVFRLGHGASETVVHTPGGTFKVEKNEAGGDGNHSKQIAVSMRERGLNGCRLLEQEKSIKPPKPKIDKGPPGQHN